MGFNITRLSEWNKCFSMDGRLTRGLLRGLVDRPEEAPLMDRDLKLHNIHSKEVSASHLAHCRNSIGGSACCVGEKWLIIDFIPGQRQQFNIRQIHVNFLCRPLGLFVDYAIFTFWVAIKFEQFIISHPKDVKGHHSLLWGSVWGPEFFRTSLCIRWWASVILQ